MQEGSFHKLSLSPTQVKELLKNTQRAIQLLEERSLQILKIPFNVFVLNAARKANNTVKKMLLEPESLGAKGFKVQ